MNLMQILYSLPPQVYIRRGELVIQFSNPADLVGRISETAASLAQLERSTPESARQDGKPERVRRTASRPPAVDGPHAVPPGQSEDPSDSAEPGFSPP